MAAMRRGGIVSVPGVYAGFIHAFLFSDAFEKGHTFKMGQTHAEKHMPFLHHCINEEQLRPETLISHRISLNEAVEDYRTFDLKQDECRKVIMTP